MDDFIIEKAVESDSVKKEPIHEEENESFSVHEKNNDGPVQPSTPDSIVIGKIDPIQQPASFDATIDDSDEYNSNIDPGLKEESNKTLFITIAVVIGVFAILFASFYGYNSLTGDVVLDMQGLHEANLQGDLDEESGYMYNEFSFVFVDGLWWTDIITHNQNIEEKVRIPLHFGPRDFDEVKLSGSTSDEFNKGIDVYMAIDPAVRDKYYSLAISELVFNMAKGIDRRPIGACTIEDIECYDRPIISCENNPDNLPVIELVVDFDVNSTIELDGTCMKITGNGYGLVKAVDRLLLQWYGVI